MTRTGRPALSADDKHSEKVIVRLTPEESKKLDDYCSRKELSRAEAIRTIINTLL
jgi:hypothetical protein